MTPHEEARVLNQDFRVKARNKAINDGQVVFFTASGTQIRQNYRLHSFREFNQRANMCNLAISLFRRRIHTNGHLT